MTIAERVSKYLKKNGIRKKWLADAVGINPVTLGASLNGKRKLGAEEYIRICEVLGVSAEDLANFDDVA